MADQDPWQLPNPIRKFSQEVDRLFDELIHRRWGGERPSTPTESRSKTSLWQPELDLYETADAFVLEADLPGVKKQNVLVQVEHGDLVLQGIRTVTRKTQGSNFYRQERHAGQFTRRLPLSASVDQDRIKATFRNGVLRAILPKRQIRKEDPSV